MASERTRHRPGLSVKAQATLYAVATFITYGMLSMMDDLAPPYATELETLTLTLALVTVTALAIKYG